MEQHAKYFRNKRSHGNIITQRNLKHLLETGVPA